MLAAAASTSTAPAQAQKDSIFLELILWVSFTAPLVLLQLPYENIDGNLVPTVVFNGLSSTIFQGFLVSIILAFTGAFCALMINDAMSRVTRAFRYLSMASVSSAIVLLLWALTVNSAPKLKRFVTPIK